MSLRIAMAAQGARLISETREHVAFEHIRHGIPIRFVESGSVLARTVKTTIHARFLTPAGPVFQLSHRTLPFKSPLRRRGHQSVGDFRLVSARPGSTQALIGERGHAILHDLGRTASLDSCGAELTLTLAGQIGAIQVVPVTELMVTMGQADIFGLSELRALPGARYHAPSGDYDDRSRPWVEVHAPTRVDLAPIAVTGVAQTWAGRAYDHREPFYAAVMPGTHDALDALDLQLNGDHKRHLASLGEGTLSAREGALTFTWVGVETDPDRLMACVRLLATFPPSHQTSAYR